MTFVVVLFSCALGDPLCTHPDATWSGESYSREVCEELPRKELKTCIIRRATSDGIRAEYEQARFLAANPTREVVSFEVMSKARWEHLRGSYNCSQIGGGE